MAEALALLRRLVAEPATPPARRLAAMAVLSQPPDPTWWEAGRFAGTRMSGSDRGLVRPPLHLSPTQAELYESCPRRYALERRLGAGEAASVYAQFGGLIHETLERAERSALQRRVPHAELEEALTALDSIWESADFGGPVLTEAWKRRGRKLIEKLYTHWPGRKAVPVALERKLDLELGEVMWHGRADRIEQTEPNHLRVVDYKTSTRTPTYEEAGQSIQLGFYVLAVDSDPELRALGRPDQAELWYPLASGDKPKVRRLEGILIEGVRARMEEVARSIAAEQWPPKVGAHCRSCSVRLVCPAWPEGREAWVA
jgi:RecB family exonuclease